MEDDGEEEVDARSENKENKRLGLSGGRSSPTSDKRKITIVEGKNCYKICLSVLKWLC